MSAHEFQVVRLKLGSGGNEGDQIGHVGSRRAVVGEHAILAPVHKIAVLIASPVSFGNSI